MACFIVPLTQAIATTVYRKHTTRQDSFVGRNLRTLELMLWGGSIMLIVDHIINGELTWLFPFFTALNAEGGGTQMLWEMLTVGLPISLVVTLVWAVWCYSKERRAVHA
ncbi:MAG: hypothetical protein IJ169_06340 [Paludibacteraceae bacterium]|nr:hypothetical protein [Paludibacteraceae bacterium]